MEGANTHTHTSPLTSSCSSSVSSSLTTGLARVRPIRLLPFPRSLLFSLRPRRIFTFTERARGWTHTHVHIIHMQMQTHTHTPQDQHNTVYCKVTVMAGLIALSVFHSFFIFLNIFLFLLPSCASSFLTSFLQWWLTLWLGAFVQVLLLFLTVLSLAVLLLLDLLSQTGEHRLEHDGVLVDLGTRQQPDSHQTIDRCSYFRLMHRCSWTCANNGIVIWSTAYCYSALTCFKSFK